MHSAGRLSRSKTLAVFGLFLLVVAFVFDGAVVTTYQAWQQEEYSHGFLIPLIAIVILMNGMEKVEQSPRGSWGGVVLMLTCVAAQFFFAMAGTRGLQPQMLYLFIISFFLSVYGLKAAKKSWPALLFLFFAFPLPRFLYYTISIDMQALSTSLGVSLLDWIGISVFQDGNIVDLGTYKLQVVEACNGLRYLFPLMAFGYLVALVHKMSAVKRVVLFLSTIPLTIFMNGLRIALIGITVNVWGIQMAEGLLHEVEGWVIFLVCLLALWAEIKLMQLVRPPVHLDFDLLKRPRFTSVFRPAQSKITHAVFLLLSIALALGILLSATMPSYLRPVPLQRSLAVFPMRIGEWTGRMGSLDEPSLKVLGTEDYLIADYRNPDSENVNLYILYYPQQDGTSNQAVHTPSGCLPSGGWTIEKLSRIDEPNVAPLTQQTEPAQVNRLVASKEGTRMLVHYWYIQNGKILASGNQARLEVIRNALFNGRTNGAMVRLTTPLDDKGEDVAEKRLQTFLQNGGQEAIDNGLRGRE